MPGSAGASAGDTARRIAVIGGGDAAAENLRLAETIGRRLAERGYTLVTGGLGGVMEAAARGARQAGGEVIGILPGFSRREANPFVTIPIATGLGHMRNALVVLNADAVVAVAGGFGTLSEIALANLHQRPVFGLGTWEIRGVTQVPTVEEALARIEEHFAEQL